MGNVLLKDRDKQDLGRVERGEGGRKRQRGWAMYCSKTETNRTWDDGAGRERGLLCGGVSVFQPTHAPYLPPTFLHSHTCA